MADGIEDAGSEDPVTTVKDQGYVGRVIWGRYMVFGVSGVRILFRDKLITPWGLLNESNLMVDETNEVDLGIGEVCLCPVFEKKAHKRTEAATMACPPRNSMKGMPYEKSGQQEHYRRSVTGCVFLSYPGAVHGTRNQGSQRVSENWRHA